MSHINLLSVDPDFMASNGKAFDGIGAKSAKKLSQIIPKTRSSSLDGILKQADISARYRKGLARVFYINRECSCFSKLNINDVDPFEIADTLKVFTGISGKRAKSLENALRLRPLIENEDVFWRLLKKCGSLKNSSSADL